MMFLNVRKSGALTACLTFLVVSAFAQVDSLSAVKEIQSHRLKQLKEFRDPKASPLPAKERKKLRKLNYYPIDLKYRLNARFVKTETPVLFKMKTTTTRLPDYRKYGEVIFNLDSQEYRLEVYQSPDITGRPGYEDYLFIPFTDPTNGEETYDVGRYIDFRIPATEHVTVDFNQSYNPYCSYNSNYSCPIPPAANNLSIAIRAGEKKFKGH